MLDFKKVVKMQSDKHGQTQLAANLGVSVNTIRTWENEGLGDLAVIRLRAIVKLARMAGVKVEAIV